MRSKSLLQPLARVAAMLLIFAGLAHGAESNRDIIPLAKATFAGGCFWCMEPPYDELEGVTSTISGYTGGTKKNPTYEQVSAGTTGHTEAVEITYDPKKISYEKLLDVFWRNIDPLTANAQFCDSGSQYRSAIFYQNEGQKNIAEQVKRQVDKSKKWKNPVVTQIVPASEFTPAEEYHQDYLEKNPGGYTCHFLRE